MGNPTHFKTGVSSAKRNEPLHNFGMPDPTKYHVYFNDFDHFAAADWTVTESQAGATQALTDGDGGLLALVNTALDNDLNSIQKVGESFLFAAAKRFFMASRFKVSEATQSDVLIGLAITDTSPIATAPTDGIHFLKSDEAATIIAKVGLNSSYASSGSAGTLANDTFFEIGLAYEARPRTVDGVTYYDFDVYVKDANGVWGHTATAAAISTNLPTDEVLTPTIAVQNGDGNARTLTVDYLLVANER